MSEKFECIVIGAGAVGLAIAAQLSKKKIKNLAVFEKNEAFGKDTSSRNSEVNHSGLYYPEWSLKTKLCVLGNPKISEYCKKKNISYRNCGKYVIAIDSAEEEDLHKIREQSKKNNVPFFDYYSKSEFQKKYPHINCAAVCFSKTSGVFDTHSYMRSLEFDISENGGLVSYNSEVIAIEKKNGYYSLEIKDTTTNEIISVLTEVVINSCGLYSVELAKRAGFDTEKLGYKLYYAKGEYFALSGKYLNYFDSLFYPVAPKNGKSLGLHIVIDMHGRLKIGPNVFYVDKIDYSVDASHISEFFNAAKRYFKDISIDELSPDMAGIRPKLQAPDEQFRDFLIKNEADNGYKNFINLIGIESPGLTASLAIAEYVEKLII